MTTVTIASDNHRFQQGDIFSMDVPDRRWWKRAWAWVLRRPEPTVKKYFTIDQEFSSNSFSIVPKG